MGFFKKMLKQVKLKHLFGIAELIPVVGPYAKKVKEIGSKINFSKSRKQQAINVGNIALAQKHSANIQQQTEELKQVEQQYAPVLAQHDIQPASKSNPDLKDILQGALGGFFQGAGNVLTHGDQAQEFAANAADATLKGWIRKNVGIVIAAALGLILIVVLVMKGRR